MQPSDPYTPPNPYAPPRSSDFVAQPLAVDPGNYWLGFLAAFFFALIGLIIVYVRGKPESKRGAGHGFLARIGLVVLIVLFVS